MVAVFLTETNTRHSILRKEKRAKEGKARLRMTNRKLTGTREAPVEVGDGVPGRLGEQSDEVSHKRLEGIPAAGQERASGRSRLPKEESRDGLFISDNFAAAYT